MNPIRRLGAAFKAAGSFVAMRFSRGWGWAWNNLGATSHDFRRSVGDPSLNVIVLACVRWMQRTYPEAKLTVRQIQPSGEQPTGVPDHPLAVLLRKPNPYYSGLLLWMATVADYTVSGNAYWIKVRSGAGAPVQLWWAPSTTMEPRWPQGDQTVYISHYDYTIDGQAAQIAPEDVVHFRNGLDPNNVRKGRSDVQALVREIATDNEAANWTASMLRNMGIPGVLISAGAGVELSQDDADEIKSGFNQRFGGDRRGEAMVIASPADVKVLSFSPEQMQMRDLRRVPEERVTSLLGIPAMVVGLGAGLDRSTFSNYEEARSAAYETNLIPLQRLFADELNAQLVPDFGDPTRLLVEYDYSDVRTLQDDMNALHERARADLMAGLITRNQALAMIGEKADETASGDVLYIPIAVSPIAADDILGPRVAPVRETITDATPGQTPPDLNAPKGRHPEPFPQWLNKAVAELLAERPKGLSKRAWEEVVYSQAREMVKAGNADALARWFEDGADGQIDWGSPGDFEQCVAVAEQYLDDPEGYCNVRHQAAVGVAPGGED